MQERIKDAVKEAFDNAQTRGRLLCDLAIADLRTIGKYYVLKVDGGYLRLKKGVCPTVEIEEATIVPEAHVKELIGALIDTSGEKKPPEAVSYQKELAKEIEKQAGYVEFIATLPTDLMEAIEKIVTKFEGYLEEESGSDKTEEEKPVDISELIKKFLKQ